MALAGTDDVYSAAHHLLDTLLGSPISRTQVYRVSDALGKQLEQTPVEPPPVKLMGNKRVYASIDGSMIQTDDGWKEVKLGRVFQAVHLSVVGGTSQRHRITESRYSACLGSCHEFIPRFEARLTPYEQAGAAFVFITDGAEWIRDYTQQRYPEATHILDYYHAAENLATFAATVFADDTTRQAWLKARKAQLYEGQIDALLVHLKGMTLTTATARKARYQLCTDYENNRSRMDYAVYRAQGLMIGSGPIEAAHRTVLQARMKRSGQHWSRDGAKHMINLRVALKSDAWDSSVLPLLGRPA